jgi:oxazoline/thiazoline dehydrogenase
VSDIRIGLAPGVVLETAQGGEPSLKVRERRIPGDRLALCPTELLERLAAGDSTEATLEDYALQEGDTLGLAAWLDMLRRLRQHGLVAWTAYSRGRPLARLVPTAAAFAGISEVPCDGKLSRFAHIRVENGTPVLRSPFGCARVELLHSAAATLVFRLMSARVPTATGTDKANGALLRLFAAAGAIDSGEPDSTPTSTWEFEDALLFGRTRTVRNDMPRGATYRFAREMAPLPAVKPAMSGETIALRRSDATENSTTLQHALEARRSRRVHGSVPIAVDQLGELLFRTAALRGEPGLTGADSRAYEIARRVHPGAGACHPLEIYALVDRCSGLGGGLYHYDAWAHSLVHLQVDERFSDRLFDPARANMEGGQTPQVLLIIAARFRRISWKYEGVAYALLLAELGALYQTLQLVAESMGLAGCPLGAGDGEAFSALIGVPLAGESSIGEFMLGSR